tara:strand:+ start:12528 stop:12719 length:192 start_codon:yes stop_codon:yes gene_type:complete
MTQTSDRLNAATTLRAAHRYLTYILTVLSIDTESMTLKTFKELIEYFSENPNEFIEITNDSKS